MGHAPTHTYTHTHTHTPTPPTVLRGPGPRPKLVEEPSCYAEGKRSRAASVCGLSLPAQSLVFPLKRFIDPPFVVCVSRERERREGVLCTVAHLRAHLASHPTLIDHNIREIVTQTHRAHTHTLAWTQAADSPPPLSRHTHTLSSSSCVTPSGTSISAS